MKDTLYVSKHIHITRDMEALDPGCDEGKGSHRKWKQLEQRREQRHAHIKAGHRINYNRVSFCQIGICGDRR
jgi:hypothetical protein